MADFLLTLRLQVFTVGMADNSDICLLETPDSPLTFHRAFNLYPLSVIKRNDKYFVRLFDLPSMLIITKSPELPNKNRDCSTFAH